MSRSLDGTWVVAAYRSGDDLVAPQDQGPDATLTIEDGSVFGSMGINRFTGSVERGLIAGPLATTRMSGPTRLMEQEDSLLRHLTDADAIEVDGNGMTVYCAGLNVIELRRSGTNDDDHSSQ